MARTPTQVKVAKVTAVSAVVVAAIGVIGTWIATRKPSDNRPAGPTYLTLAVFDDVSKKGIEDAETTLRVGSLIFDGRTDSNGRKIYQLQKTSVGQVAHIRVTKTGYAPRGIEFAVPDGGDAKEIYMSTVAPQVAEVVKTTVSPSDALRNAGRGEPLVGGGGFGQPSTTIGSDQTTGPPVNVTRDVEYEVVTETYRSGPRPSALGAAFSDWYTLCTPPLSAGAEILNVAYRLEGDRQCGAWSECRLGENTATRACFEFRLQGHDEVFPPREFMSEGFLTVTYRRQSARRLTSR